MLGRRSSGLHAAKEERRACSRHGAWLRGALPASGRGAQQAFFSTCRRGPSVGPSQAGAASTRAEIISRLEIGILAQGGGRHIAVGDRIGWRCQRISDLEGALERGPDRQGEDCERQRLPVARDDAEEAGEIKCDDCERGLAGAFCKIIDVAKRVEWNEAKDDRA